MGANTSNRNNSIAARPDDMTSQDVDLQLIQQQLDELFKSKVLLLGAGESGKSTVVKQLRLIHKKPVTEKELILVIVSLYQNIVDCFKAIINASINYGYYNLDAEDKNTEQELFKFTEQDKITPLLALKLIRLFKTDCIQKSLERKSEFWILDSFPYLFKNLERIAEPDFIPTEEDCVMARIRTIGVVVSELEQKINKDDPDEPDVISFQIVDVGGQRNERKKWIHCFSDVKAILFVVNLASYNQVLFEDQEKNRMEEELQLFQQVVNNPLFKETPIFLFLNKKDIFEPMVTEVDIQKQFHSYTGGKKVESSLQFLAAQFLQFVPPDKKVHVQVVAARWKRDIRAAFEEVKQILYDQNRQSLIEQARKIKNQRRKVDNNISIAKGEKQSKCGCFG